KRAEDALRTSEARYARAMEAAGDGHSEWNPETDEFYASPRLLEICGFPADTKFSGRADFLARLPLHPEDRDRFLEAIEGHYAGRSTRLEVDVRLLRRGETRWMHTTLLCSRDAAGALLRGSTANTDVTERKLAEEALRESEARFRALTELSSDWYWEQDENLRFTYLSSQADDLTGYPGGSSIGKTRWELAEIAPVSCSWPEHQAVLAARQPFRDLELRRVGPDGTVRYLGVSGAPIFDAQGRFKGYQGVGRNITERKRIEEALRLSEERFALAVRGANEGIFDWDLVTDRVYVSQRAQELFGMPAGELWRPRRQWREILNFHPEDAKLQHDSIKALIAGESPTYDVEFRIILADGSHRWFRQRGIALRDASGKVYRMVGSIGDITDRKTAQEDRLRLERQLRLAQRLEAMGTLAGGIAHDFNNILGAILGYGEMALRSAPKGTRLRRDLDSIMTAGERGRALVDRVLAFSRSGLGERVAVHVEKVVGEALDLLAAKLPKGIRVETKLRAGRAAMLGDPTQIHQVLMNLATNAIQAMPSGGTLSVSLEAAREGSRTATIGNIEAGDYVVLTVADTGTGIPREIIDRIFDPFFTTKEVGTGTGLGLSLVHGIVTELGGAIEVASTPGEGSEFIVYLPRSGEAVESDQAEAAAMPRGDGQRVLIVDDEEPLTGLAARTLEELGYVPTEFTSSTAALAAFRAEPERFDAVITDERMPGMTGSALIRELRGIRRDIPILLVSGYVGGAVASGAREAGANEVMKKPLSAHELATSLARVLRH
ncbi:MAG TPA: PAS domain S-box protein, partial [Burkholderiales bacterium]|nr:PAS domain S-box protein [Burkholderiales bacterium]